jgi:acetyltransferase-like isoleucine patch superfamily enzyme
LWFYVKATVLAILLKLPFNAPKIVFLRSMGAHIGRNVFISVDAWIDPAFPCLLTLEDNVMLGVGARIAMHEFRQDTFCAGRVIIRRRAIIGGFSLIGPGVEIGEGATVAGGTVVYRDVPAGMVAVGNPARNVKNQAGMTQEQDHE